ncbi:MAG: hypothetical protein HOG08_00880, partial [Candidatus Magasanikbacteria bacterium]|nr:hypothetical protein [Candidatus Magasanikbacteria bacterium]
MKREGAREIPDPNNREANEPPPFIDIGKPKSSVEGVQPPPLPESVRMEEIPPLINEKPEENLAITDAKEDFLELLNKSDTLSEEEKLK